MNTLINLLSITKSHRHWQPAQLQQQVKSQLLKERLAVLARHARLV